ncbi:MAG: hypothetical protein KDA74_24220 [Planctomycetaceae bacterium]|nr:hypothetical protein [Planctomycetaceae bacterium]MCA9023285.1 hypothetical protein [Planctomycetaceae bacterium]
MNYELTDLYLDLIDERKWQRTPQQAGIEKLLDEIDSDTELGRAERALLRGYLNYHFRDVMQPIDRETEFRLAVELAPDDHLANLYLGYETFDAGKYDTALEQFQKLDLNKHVHWSQIKIRELIVCCHLHLQQFLEAEELLCPVLRQAMELDSNDDYAHPIELLEALAEWHAEFSAVIGADAWQCDIKLLMDVLQKYDLTDTFAEQLAQISP